MKKIFMPSKLYYMDFMELLINYTLTTDDYGAFDWKYNGDDINTYLSEYSSKNPLI